MLDFFDRMVAVSYEGLTTDDVDFTRDGFRRSFKTPVELVEMMKLAWDMPRVVDLAQGLIINSLPQLFVPDGPMWVDLRVHRGGETEEEDEDITRPIIGVWLFDQRVLGAKREDGLAMLFVDRRGIEHALEEMIEWLEAPLVGPETLVAFSIEEAAKRIQWARRAGYAIYSVGSSMPTDDTTMAIIRGERMELLVGDAHSDTVTLVDLPAFPRHLLNSMEREFLLGDDVSMVYPSR